jgi:hypothetical protein
MEPIGVRGRNLRRLAAGISLLAVWACNDHRVQAPTPSPLNVYKNFYDQNVNNDLDILFMVDDSSSMTTVQQNVGRNFPVFMGVLKSLPAGLPNVHIAVVTSNMGAGAFTGKIFNQDGTANTCNMPDGGRFVDRPRAASAVADPRCAAAKLNPGAHFIESFNNGTQNNFSGAIEDVFSCIAQVDAVGCGFEHQLAAVKTALGDPEHGVAPPDQNAGFLRRDAYLAIIWITNEDDCSAPADSLLFSTEQNPTDSSGRPLGPFASFRCTEYGIMCGGQRVPTTPTTAPLLACASADQYFQSDPKHSLVPVKTYIDYFQHLKRLPNHVIGAAIAAPPDPFNVSLDNAPGHNNWSQLSHNCFTTACATDPRCDMRSAQYDEKHCDCVFGDPAVRLNQVVGSFGQQGTFVNICQDDYRESMRVIAQLIGRRLGRQCIDGTLADPASGLKKPVAALAAGAVMDPNRVSCSIREVQYLGTSQQTMSPPMSPCNPAGQASGTCWAILGDTQCSSGAKTVICRNGFNPASPDKPCLDGPTMAADGTTAVIECATTPK